MDTQNIASYEHGLNLNDVFNSLDRPSLPREVLTVNQQNGPFGIVFAIDRQENNNGFTIKSVKTKVEDQMPIRVTSITPELISDLRQIYGENAFKLVARLLNGIARDYENDKFIEWMNNNAIKTNDLEIATTDDCTDTWRKVLQKVQTLVLESNVKRRTTFNAFCILPFKVAASIMGDPNAVSVFQSNERNAQKYLIAKSLSTEYYLNPDPNSEFGYVGIRSTHNENIDDTDNMSCGAFNAYVNEIQEITDVNANYHYVIYDRFSICSNPLHSEQTPMLYKFNIKYVERDFIEALSKPDIDEVIGQ